MAYCTISIGSGLVDSIYGNCQTPIKSYMMQQAEAFEKASALKLLCREEKSKHWAEAYGGETAMGNFQPVGEGGATPSTGFEETYMQELTNMTWKLGFSVTQELIEDGQLGKVKQRAKKLMTSYNRTRELFMRYLYIGAVMGRDVSFEGMKFKTTSADGKAAFDTTHPCKVVKKNQTNKYDGAFSADILDKGETEMQNIVGDNNELLGITPNTILIPNDATLKRSVFEVIGADKDPDTANNGFNYQFGRWNVVVDPYLTLACQKLGLAQMPWFLIDSKFIEDSDCVILQNRVPLSVVSDIDKDTQNNMWNGRARFTGGFVDWRGIAAFNVSGGTSLA